MTLHRFKDLTDNIQYKPGWEFEYIQEGGRWSMRVTFWDVAATAFPNQRPHKQNGRWFRLSEHMTDGEVVQTAFLAIKLCEEHECRETFRYKGVALFGPHIDLRVLVEAGKAVRERAPL